MEEVDKLQIKTSFMKRFISMAITRALYKKAGCTCKIELNDIDITNGENDMMDINLSLSVNSHDLMKLFLKLTKED